MSQLRYGHSEGHTDICYSDNFKYIVSCGSEGDVRIWDGVDDADQRDNCVGEKAWAVFQKDRNLYVGTDTNIVQAYTFPDFETDGIITRFTAPATQIVMSPNGRKLVASSCDMNIHIVDMHTLECKKLTNHKAPVLSVCIDSKCEFVASSSCDGTVRVWSVSTGNVLNQWDVLPKSNSFENSTLLCRLNFDPDGRNLAVPVGDSVKLYQRETWALVLTLMTPSNTEVVNIVKYSPCGKLIAGGTTDGMIYVWSLDSTSILRKCEAEKKAICGIAWCRSKSIAFVNTNGQLGSLDIAQPEQDLPQDNEDTVDLGNVPLGVPEFDDDDDDDENAISLEKIKSGYIVENGEIFAKPRAPSPSAADDVDDRSSIVSAGFHRSKLPLSELQQPFHPTSTPIHLQQRFMAWNIEVGVVRQFNMDDMNDIDVEFHDTSHHPSMRMNNLLGHTMASLTPELLILAAPKSDDNPSKLVVVMLKSRDGQKEWDTSFGEDDVILVTGGSGWVAVVTDLPALHVFSADGNQTDLLSVPGRPVAIIGHKDNLCIFFHTGLDTTLTSPTPGTSHGPEVRAKKGLNGDQHLSYGEFRIDRRHKRATCIGIKALPLSAKSSLRWAGYTYEGSLATFDSLGVVRILYRSSWRPICFLDKHCKSEFDHYFLLGISEYNQLIKCVLCKGAYYPPVMPKPLVTEVKWKIPLCEMESDKSQLEEEYLRSVISLPNISFDDHLDEQDRKKMEKNISVVVMKLFALACRSELDSRALSLCGAMPSVDIVKLAAKYAAKLGRHNLAEKVNEVANRMTSISPVREIVREPSSEREMTPEPVGPSVNYSQDMFADSESVKENLILNMKKKKACLSPKPIRFYRSGNPFKKQKEEDPSTSNGVEGSADSRMKFMDWYDSNRSRLQEEFPLLKEGELIMASMKLYRQEVTSKSNLSETLRVSLDDSLRPSPKSNTLDDSFKSSTKSLDESMEEKSENLPKAETKKRKLPSEESRPAKKISTSSKLKSFSFNKKKD